jgi:accessory gene regulator B
MIEKLAAIMTNFYVEKDMVPSEDTAVYTYGFQLLLSTLGNVILVMLIAIWFRQPLGALLFLGAFVLTRSVGGGYHARTHLGCIALFCGTFALCALVVTNLPPAFISLYVVIITAFSLVVAWELAPVPAPNRPLAWSKRERLNELAMKLTCVYGIIALLTHYIPYLQTVNMLFFLSGNFVASLSMVVAELIMMRK